MKYTVKFDRVGRNHAVPDLVTEAEDANDLAEEVYYYVRPMLLSNDVDVIVDMEKMSGTIAVGFHNGGDFTVHEEPDDYVDRAWEEEYRTHSSSVTGIVEGL